MPAHPLLQNAQMTVDGSPAMDQRDPLLVAVEAMEQGLLVHDGKTVKVSNQRLAEMLECPYELVEPGASIDEFMNFSTNRGDFDNGKNITVAAMWRNVDESKPFATTRTVPSGKVVRGDYRTSGNMSIITYSDVTEEEERKILLETTLATMAQGVVIHGETAIVASNDRLAEMLDLPRSLTMAGRSWIDMVSFRALRGDYGDDAEKHIAAAKQAYRDQRSFTSQYRVGENYLQTECRYEGGLMFVTYTDVTESRRQQEKLRASEERVRRLAEHDGLTGLMNRRAFDEALDTALSELRENEGSDDQPQLALMMIDLDRFKPINDTYGHKIGDLVLCDIAERFACIVSDEHVLARIGGDEFAVLTRNLEAKAVNELAEAIRMSAAEPVVVEGDENLVLRVDASVGTVMCGNVRRTPDALMVAADLALYSAKKKGRGRVCTFEPQMARSARARLTLESELRHALERKQIVLHYQVQRDLHSSRDVGYEALMRWEHPDRGMIQPNEFIPVAEETGLIVELGRWALRRATGDFAAFDDRTRVSVNVSPVQFQRSNLVEDVGSALAESGLDPWRLEIEITEQLLIDDSETTLDTLNRLRELGVGLSLDDFGSGYSSLAYLTRFPFSKIKIDRCFIDRMMKDSRSYSLVTSILALAMSLGMKVTAEGVETSEQLARLAEGRCDEAQGYLLGRPGPFEEIVRSSGDKEQAESA